MVLLKSSRLFGGALTLHLAAVAERCTERRVPPGTRFCRAGETYLVLAGRCRKLAHGPTGAPSKATLYGVGECVQEFGALYSELPPMSEVEAADEPNQAGLRLLVIEHAKLWALLVTLPPKFALSLLRALVEVA